MILQIAQLLSAFYLKMRRNHWLSLATEVKRLKASSWFQTPMRKFLTNGYACL
ncbi:hypothetical protein HanXRQr2_Chr05g0211051 [Helianthus annuus]|uniref:Uncharacterized protein n=1 Tax=Helianthus annuus TaxID=4232 RepID=A0A9K3NMT3_HELAN|nr:hypothetical protein HanXRQr2_Chr05g0211051 [Helianthus annuus]KAJ0922477.1 hypothetical protein HanPSC8_Chr05g0204311 [Helianthus annuus]